MILLAVLLGAGLGITLRNLWELPPGNEWIAWAAVACVSAALLVWIMRDEIANRVR